MEMYIPPTYYVPKPQPPRLVLPVLPIIPCPTLPETLFAPEGTYTLNPNLFPPIGTAVAPLLLDPRFGTTAAPHFSSGFVVSGPNPGVTAAQASQSALSHGGSVVNGIAQPMFPTKMSWVNVWYPPKGEKGIGGLLGMGSSKVEGSGAVPNMSGYEASVSSSDSSPASSDQPAPETLPIPLPLQSGKGRTMFSKTPSTTLPRPKNNLRSSNSTFVTRLQAADNLPRIMSERGKNGTGEMVRWGFWNMGRTFGWGEEGGKIKEPLARVTFSHIPTCHAVSHLTASPDRLDILIGFSSGDLIWMDLIVGKYTRLNKGGLLNSSAVTSVHFDPRQPAHFIATFQDSILLQFNLLLDDPVAAVTASPMPWKTFFAQSQLSSPQESFTTPSLEDGEQVFEDQLLTWKNKAEEVVEKGKDRNPWAGKNPVGAAKLGTQAITAVQYSPDARLLAAVSDDGMLRLLDVQEERLLDTFEGYFGGLTCLAWSPDSRFVAVGGQDDLITIFSSRESRLVARCQGHTAFVTSIAFDPARADGRGYRFGSVGEDGKVILVIDFSLVS
ncbi:catabolite repression protein CreC, partial [Tremellales sp. Uapishka_1]